MSGYFNDDDIDMDENELAEFNAFLEWIADAKKENERIPKIQVVNPKRLREFQYTLFKITEIVKRTNPDAWIDYTLNDDWNIGHANIGIETDEIDVSAVRDFIESVRFVTNFEVYSTLSGKIRMGIVFHDMWNEVNTEEEST